MMKWHGADIGCWIASTFNLLQYDQRQAMSTRFSLLLLRQRVAAIVSQLGVLMMNS